MVTEAISGISPGEPSRRQVCSRHAAGTQTQPLEAVVTRSSIYRAYVKLAVFPGCPIARDHIAQETFAPIEQLVFSELCHEAVGTAFPSLHGEGTDIGPVTIVAVVSRGVDIVAPEPAKNAV